MSVTKTKRKTLGYGIIAMCTDGTYVYMVCTDGWLRSYTIADASLTDLYHFDGIVVGMVTDNTYIYLFMAGGVVKRYTIATAAIAALGTAPGVSMMGDEVRATAYYGGVIYVGSLDGTLHTITTS